jgi:hypothetical protein
MEYRKCLVYFDKDRATSWIGDAAGEILAKELSGPEGGVVGAVIVNADELRQELENAVKNHWEKRYVVIFARDVIPHEVFDVVNERDPYITLPQFPQRRFVNPKPEVLASETAYADTLLVKFLHRGGAIIWLGDVPFWYLTDPTDPKSKLELWIWPHISFFGVLGVVQVFNNIPQPTSEIYDAIQFPGSGSWLSKRPVLAPRDILLDDEDKIGICIRKGLFMPLAKTMVMNGTIVTWSVKLPDGSTYDLVEPLIRQLQITIGTSRLTAQLNAENYAPITRSLQFSEEHGLTGMEKPQITITQSQPMSFAGHLSGFFKAYSAWIRCIGDYGLFIRLWDHEIRLKDEGGTLSKDDIIQIEASITGGIGRGLLRTLLGISCSKELPRRVIHGVVID